MNGRTIDVCLYVFWKRSRFKTVCHVGPAEPYSMQMNYISIPSYVFEYVKKEMCLGI